MNVKDILFKIGNVVKLTPDEVQAIKAILDEVVADARISNAMHYLYDNEVSIPDQIKAIEAQADIDGTVMIDNVEGVGVWEAIVNRFTCYEFLDLIEE